MRVTLPVANRVGARGALALVIAVAHAPSAAAQAIPDDRAIDVQTFEYAIGPKTFLTVGDADVAARRQLSFDALVTYLTKPFKIYDVDDAGNVGRERTVVVDSLAAAQMTAAYGLTDRLQIGVSLPLIFALQGGGLDAASGNATCAMPPCLSVSGIGDLLVEAKRRFYKQGPLRAAGIAGVTLPTSIGTDRSEFIGDDLPTLRARISLQYDPSSKLSFGLNAGFVARKPRTIYDSTIGPQLTWGAAAALRITERFSLIAESYGRAGIPDFSLDSSPLELEGGVRIYVTGAVAVVFGGGAGLVRGIGAPEARFFASLGYAPDVRDSDGDGVPNGRDQCVLVPEDKDGAQDGDGCPDDDNDGDRRADATDRCPNEAEDLDGFDDDDGCPELDNDKDGISDLDDKCVNDAEDRMAPNPTDGCPAAMRDSDGDDITDAADQCPQAAEDLDGFEDSDGCPEADNDRDGIADASDRCPLCPEDADGFEDGDGCPEVDNDRDGVLDALDKCPLEAETPNGVSDDDGCADTGGMTVVRLDGDRLVIDRVPSLANGALSPAGTLIVDQMALVMVRHREVRQWLVALAQPTAGEATELAAAVKTRLIARGVAAERVAVIGAAGPPRIGGVAQERGEGVDACPAGRAVVPGAKASPQAKPSGRATQPRSTKPEPAKPEPAAPESVTPGDEIEIE